MALAAWCAFGLLRTGRALADPRAGIAAVRPAEAAGAAGIPLEGADAVTAVAAMLAAPPLAGGKPALLLLPPGSPQVATQYVRAQLALAAYPRRVDVVPAGQPWPLPDYAVVLAAPGVGLRGLPAPAAQAAGYRAYLLPAR